MKSVLLINFFLYLICLRSSAEIVLDISLFHAGDIMLNQENQRKGVQIPLRIVGSPASGKLEVTTSSVRYDQVMHPDMIGAIAATIDQQGVLQLILDSKRVWSPGKYDVAFSFRSGTSFDDLNISLVIPQGKLRLPTQLAIEMTRGWFGDELKEPVPKLQLSESTGVYSVEVILPEIVRFSGNTSKNFGLVFEEKKIKIPPGQPKDVRYRVLGRFPMGFSKTSYRIAVRGEREVQTIEITVKNIITEYIIIPILLAGIFLGWLLRIFIQRRKELIDQKVQAQMLAKEIRKAIVYNHDTTFGDACENIAKDLDKVVHSKSEVAAIQKEIDDAQAKHKVAVDEFNIRQVQFNEDLGNILTAVSGTYDLPVLITDKLAKYKPGFEELRNETDLTIQEKELEKQLQALADELTVFVKDYREIQDIVTTPGKLLLPNTIEDQYNNSIGLQTALDMLAMPTNPEAFKSGLGSWNNNFLAWRKAVRTFIRGYYRYFNEVYEHLKRFSISKTDLTNQKKELDGLMGLADRPETYLKTDQHFLQVLHTLSEGWNKIFKSLDTEASVTYQNAVAKADYVEALTELESGTHARFIKGRIKPVDEASTFDEQSILQADESIAEIRLHLIRSSKPNTTYYNLLTEKRGWLIFENLISAILICIVGFAMFSPKFDGSLSTCITIFFVGFSLDITTDSLLEYSKKLTK